MKSKMHPSGVKTVAVKVPLIWSKDLEAKAKSESERMSKESGKEIKINVSDLLRFSAQKTFGLVKINKLKKIKI